MYPRVNGQVVYLGMLWTVDSHHDSQVKLVRVSHDVGYFPAAVCRWVEADEVDPVDDSDCYAGGL